MVEEVRIYKKRTDIKPVLTLIISGAEGGNRTRMVLLPLDFEY